MITSILRKWLSLSLAIAISFAPSAWASEPAVGVLPMTAQAPLGWQAKPQDNICGLSNTRQVTCPARVDYKKVLRATPEMKDLARRGIDPRSAEGTILRQRAVDRVRRAGSKVMRNNGHCSLWKRISHRDGRKVQDLTSAVISSLKTV